MVKASWPLGECTIQNLFSHKVMTTHVKGQRSPSLSSSFQPVSMLMCVTDAACVLNMTFRLDELTQTDTVCFGFISADLGSVSCSDPVWYACNSSC